MSDARTIPDVGVVAELRTKLAGEVLAPGDDAYDQARQVHAAGIDRYPAVVTRPVDASEVAAVIAVAHGSGLPLAVRSGGHSLAGHGVRTGGITLDLSRLRRLEIDIDAHTAWAQAGLTAGEYTTAVGVHGLATGFGDAAGVGIGGLTLGGGIGPLSRAQGLTIDSLLAAEIVTADGQVRYLDVDHDPDLFWAIRGGGGNLGVATGFRYRLHEVGTVLAGLLVLPATVQTLASIVAEADAAPDELTAVIEVLPAPPLSWLPTDIHGRTVIMAMLCCTGPSEEAERSVAAFRTLATPILDLIERRSFPEVLLPDEDLPPRRSCFHPLFLDRFERDDARLVLERLSTSTAAIRSIQFRALGGAIARVPIQATAYAHRAERMLAVVTCWYERGDERSEHEAWAAGLAGDLPGRGGAYVNFLGDVDERRVRDAYPGPTWDRLVHIKSTYDPTNLFRSNHNIPPRSER